jgi:hypothetical protein
MDNETFEIKLTKYYVGGKTIYRMNVEIIHRSEQVIRFRIFAGDKSMIMEKLLLKHKGQWKIKETNFKLSGDPKDIAEKVLEMQDSIEHYLAGSPVPVNKYKNKP